MMYRRLTVSNILTKGQKATEFCNKSLFGKLCNTKSAIKACQEYFV